MWTRDMFSSDIVNNQYHRRGKLCPLAVIWLTSRFNKEIISGTMFHDLIWLFLAIYKESCIMNNMTRKKGKTIFFS